MFLGERIAYIELHKTGTTHIRRLLADEVGGEILGEHNPAPPEARRAGRAFLGSIRDPWDWYVSLWAYGCGTGGWIRDVGRFGWRGAGWRRPGAALRATAMQALLVGRRWSAVYADPDDPALFREWLRILLDPRLADRFGRDYAHCRRRLGAGLMTARYLALFTDGGCLAVDRPEDIAGHDRAHCYIDDFIRVERLEEDLLAALDRHGVALDDAARGRILSAGRTNASSRHRDPARYHDEESIARIAGAESFLASKFGYAPPQAPAP